MASAPAPTTTTRDTVFYHKTHKYTPEFNKEKQRYCDDKIKLSKFNEYGGSVKCGLCDCEHIFYKNTNFNQHLKSDKHLNKLKELNDRYLAKNIAATVPDVLDEGSIITTETPVPALTPIQEPRVDPTPPASTPAPAPIPDIQLTPDLYHTILMTEIDRLNQVIRQRDAQMLHLKQTIIHFSDYLRYEEAL